MEKGRERGRERKSEREGGEGERAKHVVTTTVADYKFRGFCYQIRRVTS